MTRENVRILSAEPFQFAPLFHSYGLSAHTLIKAWKIVEEEKKR